ncbi:MAG: hypothetical protein JO002_07015, partial [Burkholderiaceae bacterium]|nr:hypothetical protein [Burkholderiaceae bacterium]
GFIEREGGSIALRFTDDQPGADFRHFVTLIRLPDSFAVHIDGSADHARTHRDPAQSTAPVA